MEMEIGNSVKQPLTAAHLDSSSQEVIITLGRNHFEKLHQVLTKPWLALSRDGYVGGGYETSIWDSGVSETFEGNMRHTSQGL